MSWPFLIAEPIRCIGPRNGLCFACKPANWKCIDTPSLAMRQEVTRNGVNMHMDLGDVLFYMFSGSKL